MRGLAIASRAALLGGAAMMLSGCMTLRPTQDFTCPGFRNVVKSGTPGFLIDDIQKDADETETSSSQASISNEQTGLHVIPGLSAVARVEAVDGQDVFSQSILGLLDERKSDKPRDILLLSGGGQWGAYGAGLFKGLAENDSEKRYLALPNIGVITGVSTGSLQTLLLMVALDEKQSREMRERAIKSLVTGYRPDEESDVVRNTGMELVIFQGSQAGTNALRRRIGNALCPEGECSLVDAIRQSTIDGYIGFVAADSGEFQYVKVNELVQLSPDNKMAVECLTAAAMASSAMPVFHQQLRVSDGKEPKTLYDGGVRRSVFVERAAQILGETVMATVQAEELQAEREEAERRATARRNGEINLTLDPEAGDDGFDKFLAKFSDFMIKYRERAPTFYVVRNGPTIRHEQKLNGKNGARQNGQRGYDLLVNEAEIGSIAALRLYNPFGRVLITTADGWTRMDNKIWRKLKEERGMMFDPKFMEALVRLGHANAVREDGPIQGPWWELRPLDPLNTAEGDDGTTAQRKDEGTVPNFPTPSHQ